MVGLRRRANGVPNRGEVGGEHDEPNGEDRGSERYRLSEKCLPLMYYLFRERKKHKLFSIFQNNKMCIHLESIHLPGDKF
jgi:hypothetical protein